MRTRRVGIVAGIVVAALIAAGVVWWLGRSDTDLERAVAMAPADAQRLTWTDWAGVRAELDVDLDTGSSVAGVRAFLDKGFESDLTSTSALLQSAEILQQDYGFSPATLDWELLSQSTEGAVVLMGLADGTDTDALADGLEELGYQRPEAEDGVWKGGADLLATIGGAQLTPELQYLSIDADAGVIRASDKQPYLDALVADDGDGPSGVDQVVTASGDALSALVYTSETVCTELAMSGASADEQAIADQLVSEAGDVNPLTAYAMAAEPDGTIRVLMAFESDDQAKKNADSRSALARGPAPGQGGDFADRFAVDSVTAEGSLVTMVLDPVDGEYVMSDLGSGPVLFATC